jgi:hypothetical protein
MDKPVTVTYDPKRDLFTADENPVQVLPGLSTITWTIKLAASAKGAIYFGTEQDFQGIVFDPGWNGTPPKGDAKIWTVKVLDDLKPGDDPVSYHYTVNSLYQPDDLSPAERKTWDPDVEEDPNNPPPPVKDGH